MGCGGSRADALEPRYYESWTRETESTWLTCTDSDPPPGAEGPAGVLEDGPSSNGVPRPTAPGGTSNPEKKTSCGTQCSNPQSLSAGTLTQKHNGLRTTEAKRDAKRVPAKEVTLSATEQRPAGGGSRGAAESCAR